VPKLFSSSLRGFMVLLFGRLYELRAGEAAAGERVVVVGPPCAGKTTFIKQFLESKLKEKFGDSSRVEEVTAGLAPKAEEAQKGGMRKRAVRLLKRLAEGGYVPRGRVERELADI